MENKDGIYVIQVYHKTFAPNSRSYRKGDIEKLGVSLQFFHKTYEGARIHVFEMMEECRCGISEIINQKPFDGEFCTLEENDEERKLTLKYGRTPRESVGPFFTRWGVLDKIEVFYLDLLE